jgi:hypothetical protein
MGYSCTTAASNVLGIIGHMFQTKGNPNILTLRGGEYFFERGRENGDGSITGVLMFCIPDSAYCRRAGAVRIEPDGRIARFPKLTAADKQEIQNSLDDLTVRNPHLLHSWASGRL